MLLWIDRYLKLLTEVLGWGSFLAIGLAGITLLLGRRRKFLGWCCCGYGVAFLIFRLCFTAVYFRWMPSVAIFLMIFSTAWSNYMDCVNGKRWWNS